MVKKVLLFLIFCTVSLWGQEVVVTGEIEGKPNAGMPIKGTITITHDRSSQIDPASFLLGSSRLEVDYLKEVQVSPTSTLVISIYQFTLEPQDPGLHALPEISVTVGGAVYRSIASTFEVEEPVPAKRSSAADGSIILKLETLVEGEPTLYPGQRITVGYRYVYNYSVDLSHEEIPLLEAKGLRKVGGKDSNQYVKDKLIYLDVTQVVEASEPGEYRFPPGKIQGRAYKKDRLGQKKYARSETYAESGPVTINVLPFPEEGKPASFNGAIGESLSFEVKRLTSEQVAVGDKIELLITIKGTGELTTLPIPEVCCQPGFSGFFRLSDLPPVEEIQGATKTFKVEMRPLTDKIKEIPTLEFSYFNPKKKSYETLKSDPIPLKVIPMLLPAQEKQPMPEEKQPIQQPEKEKLPVPQAIEIEGNFPLEVSDLKNQLFGTWKVLFILPFAIGALFLQVHMRRFLLQRRMRVKEKDSSDLFREALEEKVGTARFFDLLHRAFVLRLVERGDLTDPNVPIDRLPETGAAGDVRAFLQEIEINRFSGKEGQWEKDLIKKAKSLFNEVN